MTYNEIHSIQFTKSTYLLIYESEERSRTSKILQPHIDGETIPTFKVEPWMFRRTENDY